jgi:hypothetical protein
MNQEMKYQGRSSSQKLNRRDMEFDQWAKAVRQQMEAALKRRGNS